MTFAEIIGQEEIKNHLQSALQQHKVSHAYIINGEAESGKKLMAEAFVAALLCAEEGIESCGVCKSCHQMLTHNHPDVKYVIAPTVDEVREQINGDIIVKPYSSKYKVYIVEHAEEMTVNAQNALLKTIEEPPEYGVILLLVINDQRLLQTIRSRCVTLNIKPLRDEQIKPRLIETFHVPDYEANVLTAFAQGNLGRAVRLAESEAFVEARKDVMRLSSKVTNMNDAEAIELAKELSETYKSSRKKQVYSKDPNATVEIPDEISLPEFLDLLVVWYRDVLLYKASQKTSGMIYSDALHQIRTQAAKLDYETLEWILKSIEKTKRQLQSNVSGEVALDSLLLSIKENY